jgi:type I restriction enzyme R subunit
LLDFPRGALVHFAVSNRTVMMTTRLQGPGHPLPALQPGDHGAAGNPPNAGGHRTAYLWEQVWERESWLEIIGRYLVTQARQQEADHRVIFPRYHQLDATRKLVAAVLAEGPGQKYLIQHSAGSGKTNSIAWTAHFLADLHDAGNKKLFDSVLVVSDRNVLDAQLQEAIFDFERTAGVVATIKGEQRQQERRAGRSAGRRQEDRRLHHPDLPVRPEGRAGAGGHRGQALRGDCRRGPQLQTGEAAAKLKQVLIADELGRPGRRWRGQHRRPAGRADGGACQAPSLEARASPTSPSPPRPRPRRWSCSAAPQPDQPAGPDNLPAPFHVYSMRQAIEEGFILDVLKNYTPTSWPSSWPTTARNGTRSRSSAARP